MSPSVTTDYLHRIEDDLRQNVLPFWIDRVVNRDGGNPYCLISTDALEIWRELQKS